MVTEIHNVVTLPLLVRCFWSDYLIFRETTATYVSDTSHNHFTSSSTSGVFCQKINSKNINKRSTDL